VSVQFGRWNFAGQPPAPDYIEKVSSVIAPYGPDGNERYSVDGVTILYRAFCTTKESCGERHPHPCTSGAMLTWDGVLDNRNELIAELRDSVTASSTDAAIVAAAYEKWREKCLPKLIGDWAISVWNPADQTLLLARDPLGTHYLYYAFDKDSAAWCTILEPLVRFAGKTFSARVGAWTLAASRSRPYLTCRKNWNRSCIV